jgi:class 3 adenylate cyclase/tetratricopeptide (TPR) repeat protein
MTGIREWLEALGLERYTQLFEQAEIDIETVPHLSETDLKEIGLPVGPRRKVLTAASSHRPQRQLANDFAYRERRHITVMFVDMVGSTRLSVSTDPEIMSELLKTFKEAVSAKVLQLGGTVTKFLGDGVLACFGWPHAKEDAAESAIRCGLEVVNRVQLIHAPASRQLRCRIGVATGLLVIGEASHGNGHAQDDDVAGEPLNLAARLLSVAEPGSIAMDSRTRRLVAQIFDCQDLGAHHLDGFDSPVNAWRPTGVAADRDRFTATRKIKTALIGRDEELASLHEHWAQAYQSNGHAVTVVGEAGIGKSRLCLALRAQAGQAPHIFLSLQCSAYHQTNALYPVIDYLTRAADIEDTDLHPVRLQKLVRLLRRAQIPLQNGLPIFADLLSIPPEAGYVAAELQPQQRKDSVIAELSNAFGRLAELQPLLLVLEDAHWVDATTLELMTRLIQTVSHARMLVLIMVRPEFTSPWIGLPQVSRLSLKRLSERQCEDLVREMDAMRDLQESTVQQIVTKCDGNPLFLEEISLAVLENGVADTEQVPDTLQGSLMSRLDKLAEAKRTAQICAVLGRRFARPLLSQIAELDPSTLDGNLSLLVTRGIIHPLGRSGDGRYEFKHALLRDAAYNSLLLSHRKRLHEHCALQLEQHFPDVAQSEPELLAYHFAQAGLAARAADYAEQTGDRAADKFSFSEAIASYREAIRNNALAPPGVVREQRTLSLLLKLGPALGIINGPQDAETRETYLHAEQLGGSLGDTENLFKAIWGLWYSANICREFEEAAGFADKLVILSRNSGDDGHVLEGLHCRWSTALFQGRLEIAHRDADKGISLYDSHRHHRLAGTFGGHDPGVCACGSGGLALTVLGHLQAGPVRAAQGVELAETLTHAHSLAHALMQHAIASAIARNCAAVENSATRLVKVSERFNFPPHLSGGRFLQGWAQFNTGNAVSGLNRMTAEFGRLVAIGPLPLFYVALYAEVLSKAGRAEQVLSVVDQSLQGRPSEVGFHISEVYRIRGNCFRILGQPKAASRDLKQAAGIAKKQGAKLLRLRVTATSLQLAYNDRDKEMGMAALKEMLSQMPADADGPDLFEARALLDS